MLVWLRDGGVISRVNVAQAVIIGFLEVCDRFQDSWRIDAFSDDPQERVLPTTFSLASELSVN
jgi:hypothetical protein